MVLLCSAVSVALDAFPEAPPEHAGSSNKPCALRSHGHNWEPAQAVWLVGTIVFFIWGKFCWLHASSVRTLNGLNGLYNGHEVLAAISFSLKTEQKAAACLGLAASPMTGSWTTPAYSLLLWGPLLPTGLENSWILTACFFDIIMLSPTAIKFLVCRGVLVFHQTTLARRGKLPLSCISVLKFHTSLWILFKTKPH